MLSDGIRQLAYIPGLARAWRYPKRSTWRQEPTSTCLAAISISTAATHHPNSPRRAWGESPPMSSLRIGVDRRNLPAHGSHPGGALASERACEIRKQTLSVSLLFGLPRWGVSPGGGVTAQRSTRPPGQHPEGLRSRIGRGFLASGTRGPHLRQRGHDRLDGGVQVLVGELLGCEVEQGDGGSVLLRGPGVVHQSDCYQGLTLSEKPSGGGEQEQGHEHADVDEDRAAHTPQGRRKGVAFRGRPGGVQPCEPSPAPQPRSRHRKKTT
jgi:hypothetical protein